MAYSGSLYFNVNVLSTPLSSQDTLEFRLVSEYSPTSNNFTASSDVGNLNLTLQSTAFGQLPYATSSIEYGNFIRDIGSNYIQLSDNLSGFYSNYQQVPYFLSGAVNPVIVSSSLYNSYGDISYPFSIDFSDKVVLIGIDGKYQILSVVSTQIIGTNLQINVDPRIYDIWVQNEKLVSTMLVLKRIKDEQNIILAYNKPVGNTSYGFIIPENITLELLDNISGIQSNVQNQLLSTQENTQ